MDSLVNTLSSDVGDLKKMVSFTTFTESGGGMLEGAKNIYGRQK